MPRTVGDAPSTYTRVPQHEAPPQPRFEPLNIRLHDLTVGSLKLDDLMKSLASVKGDKDAPIHAGGDGVHVHFLIPTSRGSAPSSSLWTKFKAALSNLPLFNRSAAIRAARLEVSASPLPEKALDQMFRNGVVKAIRDELGEEVGKLASRDLQDAPLSKRAVDSVVLNAFANANALNRQKLADEAVAARTGVEVGRARLDVGKTPERATLARMRKAAKPEPILKLPSAGRHQELLKYCTALVKTKLGESSTSEKIEIAAAQLHDRVQASLRMNGASSESRTRAPYFDAQVKPLVQSLASSGTTALLPDGRHAGLLLYCFELVEKQPGTKAGDSVLDRATQLHDRVRADLKNSRAWPPQDSVELDDYVSDLARFRLPAPGED